MWIKAAILVDDDNTGQFRHRLRPCVGADRPHEISFDTSVALRRGHSLVGGFDAVIGPGHLLSASVVWHQRFDDRRCRQAAYRKPLHAIHKGATRNLTMNKKVVEFYSFAGQFGLRGFHWRTPCGRISLLPGRPHHAWTDRSSKTGLWSPGQFLGVPAENIVHCRELSRTKISWGMRRSRG